MVSEEDITSNVLYQFVLARKIQLSSFQELCEPFVKHRHYWKWNGINLQLDKLYLKRKLLNTEDLFLAKSFTFYNYMSEIIYVYSICIVEI